MPTAEEQNTPAVEASSKLQNARANKPRSGSGMHGLFSGGRQDLIRALMLHEVLGQPKCKQSSLRKQS